MVPRNATRELQPIPPPTRPWKPLGIDLISDFGAVNDEFKHILVAVCYLSKFICARPLKSKTNREVISNLTEIFVIYGQPEVLQHDQGPEFTSKVGFILLDFTLSFVFVPEVFSDLIFGY